MDSLRSETATRITRPDVPARPALDEITLEDIRREQEKCAQRELVRYAFYQVDPRWRELPNAERALHREEMQELVARWADQLMVYSYSLVGTRGDADLMFWQATRDANLLHGFSAALLQSQMGPYLRVSRSYLGMTRNSIYTNRYEREYVRAYDGAARLQHARIAVNPEGCRFLFVYPFVKTREWYALSQAERQRMMDEHIAVAHAWPDIKLNTAYSYGLDDQEFVMAFESDSVGRFLDLLIALRVTEASKYTLRDTPSLTCLAMSVGECLEALG
jgi:chlorite dismutase